MKARALYLWDLCFLEMVDRKCFEGIDIRVPGVSCDLFTVRTRTTFPTIYSISPASGITCSCINLRIISIRFLRFSVSYFCPCWFS
ncbi:hypothetical protein RB195_021397 [Necator americanus]|uniref:Secreted protein n=1 Tax=Necator americanus TaxID=51031 RepID=A0ABR1EAX5_NECAM